MDPNWEHLGALVCTVWFPFGSTCVNEAKPEGSRDPPGLTRGEEEEEQVLDGRGQGTVL